MGIVQVQVKNVYGNELIYPVGENACLLARLIGKKTFSTDNIVYIQNLGFTVEVVAPSLP